MYSYHFRNPQTHQIHNGVIAGEGYVRYSFVCVITFVLLVIFLRVIFYLLAMIWREHDFLLLMNTHVFFCYRRCSGERWATAQDFHNEKIYGTHQHNALARIT